ncbi:MAG TPA: glycoside hydrolase family 25 protein [Candidatus Limnocylindrales bacterium]|nr:glycoside hydrolase family 25 protein [Candidatus Limnocylindrales bacterium]
MFRTPAPALRSAAHDQGRRSAALHSRRDWRLGALAMALLVALAAAPTASATGAPSAPSPAAGVRTDATTRLEGIDVSHWQGTINWSMVAGAGKAFAIIKATESTDYTDPMYATNHAGAKAAGLWTGAYHFAQPDASANDAVLEADYFVSVINLGARDLIPALDLEQSGSLSVPALQAWVTAWLGEVTAKIGIRPMIYTSPSFWSTHMGNTTALADAGYKTLWVAHWGVASPTVPANNWGGRGWTFWQYTSSGSVAGISGRVDLDRYNGTDLALQAYSIFNLVPLSGTVKQGQSLAATLRILRTNFPSAVSLDIAGLPAGTAATFTANPSTAASSAVTLTTSAAQAPTPIGTYPLTITGVGNGMTRTTKLNLVIADGIPPALSAPWINMVTGTLGTAGVPVRVAWVASDPSGLAGQVLQRSVNATAWSGIGLPSTAVRSTVQLLPFNSSVVERIRAVDTKANGTGWAYTPKVSNGLYQQAARGITYTGTWHSVASAGASGGSVRYSTARGATATFRFSGSSIAWVSTRGPGRGAAYVYIDGVYAQTVNLYASSGHSRAIVFTRDWATTGVHTIRVTVAGTAGHPRVEIDAFALLRKA